MSTLRSQATAESRQGFFARLFNAHGRAVRKAVTRARRGHDAPFDHLQSIPAARRALAYQAVGEALADGHPQAAFAAFGQALMLDFTSLSACLQYARLSRQSGHFAPGIDACQRLLAQTPAQIPIVAELAHLLTLANQPEAALGVLAEHDPDGLPILALREAHALGRLDRTEEAQTILTRLINSGDDALAEQARALQRDL